MKKFIILITILIWSIYSSNAQWEACNYGLSKCGWISGNFAFNSKGIFIGSANGVYLSLDSGNTWFLRKNGMRENTVRNLAAKGEYIFAAAPSIYDTTEEDLYYTRDDGENWIPTKKSPGWVFSLAIKDNLLFAGCAVGIYTSSNNGDSWNGSINGIPSDWVFHFAISGDNIFSGTSETGVFLSTDNGKSWTRKIDGFISGLATIGKNIFVGGSNLVDNIGGIYLSTNNGENWIEIGAELNLPGVSCLDNINNKLFVGLRNQYAIFTSDNGNSWNYAGNGLPKSSVQSFVAYGKYIFAATRDSGVYRAKLSDFGITDISDQNINYNDISISPNPATDYIEIDIGAKGGLHGEIGVYDVFGRCLLKTSPPAPLQVERGVRIDVSKLIPSLYFVRVGDRVNKFIKM